MKKKYLINASCDALENERISVGVNENFQFSFNSPSIRSHLSQLGFTILISLVFSIGLNAQNNPVELDQLLEIPAALTIKKTSEKITPDGVLEEDSWSTSNEIENFWQQFPFDTSKAEGQTEIMMLYDDNFLYVAVKCYTNGSEYVTPSLRRDYRFPGSDNISPGF